MARQVELTRSEMLMALTIGGWRHIESILVGRKNGHGKTDSGGWTEHIEGAGGEIAAGKVLGRYWGGDCNTFKKADIGSQVQVRTRSKLHYDLLVRDDDQDEHVFILVVGQIPCFEVVGYMRGVDAKRPEWRRAYGGREEAWFIPRQQLTGFF